MWMSRESDIEYKPNYIGRQANQPAERPKRSTRKDLDYKESPIVLDSDDETDPTVEGVVTGESTTSWTKGLLIRPKVTEVVIWDQTILYVTAVNQQGIAQKYQQL